MPFFQPPTQAVVPTVYADGHRDPFGYSVPRRGYLLMRHYRNHDRGQSVLKIGGTYQAIMHPTQAQIDSATEVYQGGHVYTVSEAVAAALTDAGYSVVA